MVLQASPEKPHVNSKNTKETKLPLSVYFLFYFFTVLEKHPEKQTTPRRSVISFYLFFRLVNGKFLIRKQTVRTVVWFVEQAEHKILSIDRTIPFREVYKKILYAIHFTLYIKVNLT